MQNEDTALFKPSQPSNGLVAAAQMRQAAEVHAAMQIARANPRDENAAFARIMRACQRPRLAEDAIYTYPRGGQKVEGPSIRLAEAMAQAWGNIDFGITELEQKHGESVVMAYAWDLETNTRQTKTFTVRHVRKARGAYIDLDDPRDVYEMTANQGARRVRACILGIIPGDIVDAAVAECNKTMAGGAGEPLKDRARNLLVAFEQFGVTQKEIETRLGHKLEAITESDLVGFKKIFASLRDGMSKKEDWFQPPAAVEQPDALPEMPDSEPAEVSA